MKIDRAILPWQKVAMEELCKIQDLKGKKILEIGGNSVALGEELLNKGAEEVIVINKQKCFNFQSEKLKFIHMDARDMTFEDGSFDVVLGIAVLEHLHNLDLVCEQIYRVLKKRGIAYLKAGGLWSCALGHHVYVHCDDVQYEFNGNNPIPDWHHLIYTKVEMKDFLLSEGINPKHAEKIVDWIYDDPVLNRYRYEDFKRIFAESRLNILSWEDITWKIPTKKIMKRLIKAGNPPGNNYSFGAIAVLLTN